MSSMLCNEHEEILDTLKSALTALGTMYPLERPSTPPSRQEFANTLRLAREFIGQMESHVAMLATVSEEYLEGDFSWEDCSSIDDNLLEMSFALDIEESQNEGFNSDEDRDYNHEKEKDNRDIITQRLSKIWPDSFDQLFPVEGLVDMILFPKKRTYAKREDDALSRLLIGYRATSVITLEMLLKESMENTLQWEDVMDLSKDIDAEANINKCLLKREKFLYRSIQGDNLMAFISYVVRTIHTLKFQIIWNELAQNDRTKYLDTAFEFLCEEKIRKMRFHTPPQKQESQWKKMRKAFSKAYQRKTTTRNYILHLYEKFGAGVFLDITWATPSDMTTGRSPLFGPLLNVMLQELELKIQEDGTYSSFDEYLQNIRSRSLLLLEQLFEALDLESIWEYVKDFVDNFPANN